MVELFLYVPIRLTMYIHEYILVQEDLALNQQYQWDIFYMEKYMKTTIQKWGNSSGIRIPKSLLQELHLDNGTEVELERVGDGIMMYPRRPTREETLDLLLERISPENMHGTELFGEEVGGEAW